MKKRQTCGDIVLCMPCASYMKYETLTTPKPWTWKNVSFKYNKCTIFIFNATTFCTCQRQCVITHRSMKYLRTTTIYIYIYQLSQRWCTTAQIGDKYRTKHSFYQTWTWLISGASIKLTPFDFDIMSFISLSCYSYKEIKSFVQLWK